LIAWDNCVSIVLPENQKECSAKRATTNKCVSYLVKMNEFALPAMIW
jgi:hypothetical protein